MKNSYSTKKLFCKTKSELIRTLRTPLPLDIVTFRFDTSAVRLCDDETENYFQDINLVIPKHFENICYLSSSFPIEFIRLPKKLRVFYHTITIACLTQFELTKYLEYITMEITPRCQTIRVKKIPKFAKIVFCDNCHDIDFLPKHVIKLKCLSVSEKLLLPKKIVYLDTIRFKSSIYLKQLKHLCIRSTQSYIDVRAFACVPEHLERLETRCKYVNAVIDNANYKISKLVVNGSSRTKIINLPNNLIFYTTTPYEVIYMTN